MTEIIKEEYSVITTDDHHRVKGLSKPRALRMSASLRAEGRPARAESRSVTRWHPITNERFQGREFVDYGW